MKKIIVVSPFPPPYFGVSTMMQNLVELELNGYSIEKFDTKLNSQYETIEVFSFNKLFRLLKYIGQYIKVLAMNKYDCAIIPHSFRLGAFLKDSVFIIISKIFGAKIILNAHGQHFGSNFYEKQNIFIRKYIDFIINLSDHLVTVGPNLMCEYSRWKIEKSYILNFVKYLNNITLLKKHKKDFVVLYLSTLTLSKGIFVLLNSIKIIQQQNISGIKFRICGDYWIKYPNEKHEIVGFIQDNNLSDYVTIVGRVEGEQKKYEFNNADLFVFPSLNDSFGLVNLEAMAYGLPILATSQGAIPSYLEEGKTGFFIKENNSEDLAIRIIELLNQKYLVRNISEYNYEKFNTEFTLEIFTKNWENLLDKVLTN